MRGAVIDIWLVGIVWMRLSAVWLSSILMASMSCFKDMRWIGARKEKTGDVGVDETLTPKF